MTNLSSDPADIADSLQRELALREFNRVHLGMAADEETPYLQLLGVGRRPNDEGDLVPIPKMTRCYHSEVVDQFSELPIHELFGLTTEQAMNLTVARWTEIKRGALEAYKKKLAKGGGNEEVLMQLLKDLIVSKTIGGGGL